MSKYASEIAYTPSGYWGNLMEGAAVLDNYAYATHYRNTPPATAGSTDDINNNANNGKNVIGRLNLDTNEAEAFFTGPAGSHFNGITFTGSTQLGETAPVRVE